MNFKKVNQNISVDDFINGADHKDSENKEKKEKSAKSDEVVLMLKLPTHLTDEIEKRIKHIYTFKDFTRNILLNDNEFFSDEVMIYLFQQSKIQNVELSDFVKYKLGFITAPREQQQRNNKIKSKLVKIPQDEKNEILSKARELNLLLNRYNLIKLCVTIETNNLFNENELKSLIKASNQANLTIKNYIEQKILNH